MNSNRLLALCVALTLTGCATEINLVAINDFHGHLEAKNHVGGIETLSATLQAWRREDKDLLLVGAGDLIGASPALSAMWADEPTIEALNLLGLRVSALGNHELDQGKDELLRQQHGGCQSPRPEAACKFRGNFSGAAFSYLAANVIDTDTGKPFLPAYRIEHVRGVKIGFIGAVLRDVNLMVQASGIKGLRFEDEADAINRVIPELRAQGVNAFVVLIHEGGQTPEPLDQPDCTQLRGPIVDIAKRLDPAIKLIVSGHTHQGYLCKVDGRVITQAQNYGRVLTRLTLAIDRNTHAIRDIRARNEVMTMTTATEMPDARIQSLLKETKARSEAALSRPIARLAVPTVSRKQNAAGESALGDLATDAQLAAVRKFGAQIVFMNSKGLRSDLHAGADGISNYGQHAVVHPFGNRMILMTLNGAQLRALLEQQMWLDEEAPDGRNVLQVSEGFSYKWDSTQPIGKRVVPGSIMLHGKPIEDTALYRIATNNFLAEGGDRLPMFKEGTDRIDTGIKDLDALIDYLVTSERAGKPAGSSEIAGRIQRIR